MSRAVRLANPKSITIVADVAIPKLNGRGKNPKGSFDVITIDTWVKFADPETGKHPIMNEDHWDEGDLHYQLYEGSFGLSVNPNDFTLGSITDPSTFFPQRSTWYYISTVYSSTDGYVKLYVDQQLRNTVTSGTTTTYNGGGGTVSTSFVPATLDSPRIGSWVDPNGEVTRSLHGQISVFRIWNIAGNGQDICPQALTDGLILQYVFGESGDIVHDTSGGEHNGQIHDADWSDDKPPSQQCQRQGFGGFFDGDADYVQLPDLGTFDDVTADLWLKFEDITGEHPVLMEDGWSPGAIHLQIYHDTFVLGINGVGDYKFSWQPIAGIWYFVSVGYSTTDKLIKLSVDNTPKDDSSLDMGGSFTYTVGTWAGGEENAGTDCPCALPALQPTHFNSPRLGAWASQDSNPNGYTGNSVVMDRSMRGQIAVFRLWDKITNGEDRCPASGSAHLVVSYNFDSLTSTLKDRSGNNHDGQIFDTKYSADYPDLSCIFHKWQMWKMMDPVTIGEHGQVSVGCSDCEGAGEETGAHQPPTEINLHEAYTNPVK